MPDERRRFTRVPFKVKAELTVNNILYSSEKINNLSVGGCLLPIEVDTEAGTKCHLKIRLSGANSKISVHADGEILRCEPEAVAIKFTEIDPDSLFHIQNIIRYNHPDIDKVEQEINNSPGLE